MLSAEAEAALAVSAAVVLEPVPATQVDVLHLESDTIGWIGPRRLVRRAVGDGCGSWSAYAERAQRIGVTRAGRADGDRIAANDFPSNRGNARKCLEN